MDTQSGLAPPRRTWAVLSLSLGVGLAVMDSTIANVALPAIARDLQVPAAESISVVNAYHLANAMALLPLAALGERIGYRRIYAFGLALLTLAALGCTVVASFHGLVLMRAAQGIGAAGVLSVNIALVRLVHPPERLGRGIAINSMMVALSMAIGPSLAGAVLALGDWPWLFAMTIPPGLAALAASLRTLPSNPGNGLPFDRTGAVMNGAFFLTLVLALNGYRQGWSVGEVGAGLAAAAAIGMLFVRNQLDKAAPLLPIDLLRIRPFRLALATSSTAFTSQTMALVALPFWLHDTLGATVVETGLYMTAWPLAIVATGPLVGRLTDRHPAGLLSSAGLAAMGLGYLSLALLEQAPSALDIAWRMALCGVGFGLYQSPNNHAILSAAPRSRSAGASGMLGTARLMGQALGASLVALVFHLAAARGPTLALHVAAAIAGAAMLVSASRLHGRVAAA